MRDWCKQCPKCQLVQKKTQAKAHLHPLPVVSEPFEVLALNLVGPFERSRQGHKYILTATCLASKYPEAIPLKGIQAETVAGGMLEIFSRTGILKTILLTDQGQQFIRKLNEQLFSVSISGKFEHLHTILRQMVAWSAGMALLLP